MATGFVKTDDVKVCSNPQLAIDAVTGTGVSPTLAHAWSEDQKTYPKFPNFCDYANSYAPCALLIHGTIDELSELLRVAIINGTEAFWSSGDRLLVWYMNRQADWKPKTLLVIFPKQKFLNTNEEDPMQKYGLVQGWRWLATSAADGSPNYQGLGLDWLRKTGLEKAAKTEAWVV
jgi:hypothetical protein